MISSVAVEGFKVLRASYRLGRATLVVGPNGRGKSTLIAATRFGATSWVPEVGRNEASAATAMRGSAMRVAIQLTDGRSFERTLAAKPKLTNGAAASWCDPEENPSEVGEKIRALFGRNADEVVENLDIVKLLEQSGAAVAEKFMQLVEGAGITPERALARGRELFRGHLDGKRKLEDGMPVAHDATTLATITRIEFELLDRLTGGGLTDALKWAKGRRLETAAEARDAKIMTNGVEEKLRELKVPAESSESLQKRRDEHCTQRDRGVEKLAAHEALTAKRAAADEAIAVAGRKDAAAAERFGAAQSAAEEIPRLREQLAEIVDPPEVAPVARVEIDAEALAAAIDPLEQAHDALKLPDDLPPPARVAVDAAELERARALDAEAETFDAQAAAVEVPGEIDAYEAELRVTAADRELRTARDDMPWRNVEQLAGLIAARAERLPEDDSQFIRGRCELLRQLAVSNSGDVVALKAAADAASTALEARRAEVAQRKTARDAALAQRSGFESDAAAKRHEARGVREAANAAATKADADVQTAYRSAQADVRELRKAGEAERKRLRLAIAEHRSKFQAATDAENERRNAAFEDARRVRTNAVTTNVAARIRINDRIRALEQDVEQARTARAETSGAVAAAQAHLAGLASASDLDVAATQAALKDEAFCIGLMDEQIKVCAAASALQRELEQLGSRYEARKAEALVYDSAEYACERLRGEDIKLRAGGLMDRVAKFLAGCGRKEAPFLRTKKNAVELGWIAGGDEVRVEAMSDGQRAIFRTALAYAVIVSRAPELRVLAAEIAECGDEERNDEALLRGLLAVADDVQVIACSCARDLHAPEGWTVIDVRDALKEEAVHAA